MLVCRVRWLISFSVKVSWLLLYLLLFLLHKNKLNQSTLCHLYRDTVILWYV